MADPFEVRMRFTYHLQHLNASVASSMKAAQYALKNRDMDEDMHSCILEQLERNSMNNRANILYFIEHLLVLATTIVPPHPAFTQMMQRDILRVVDAVAPEDGSGAANVKVVRRVLATLQQKGFLSAETVEEIEGCLGSRDTLPVELSPPVHVHVHVSGADAVTTTGVGAGRVAAGTGGIGIGSGSGSGGGGGGSTGPMSNTPSTSTITPRAGAGSARAANGQPMQRLDKRQIEQRIEEDRERHKRLRESIWAIGERDNEDEEFVRMWDEVSDVGEDDWLAAREEAQGRGEMAEALMAGM